MSSSNFLRTMTTALLVLAVVPLVAFLAVGYLIPIVLLVASLVLLGRRPRAAAGFSAVAALVLGGGVLWAGWILGVVNNDDPFANVNGLELGLRIGIPVVAVACLVAAARVWRAADREAVTA